MSEDGADAAVIPAATQRVNEDVALTTPVAQQESTRSYFLAQTLESTRTVPIVSANLPLDMTASEPQAPEADVPSQEEEGDGSEDDPDPEDPVGARLELAPYENDSAVSAESTVIGSFIYRGITYAVEPGGESVAVVAADYVKLPEEFVEAQTIVLPSMVTFDGIDYYSVTRITDNAFASLTAEAVAQHVISSDLGEADAVEKSALLMQNREAATDSTEDAEDEESSANDESIGITAITVPASITEIGEDAFTGFDTLRYVIVSADNPNYSMYDGVLYDADQMSLLLIPEGRLGAVRIPSTAVTIPEGVSSHCAYLTSFIVDADGAASQLLSENDFYNANGEKIEVTDIDVTVEPQMVVDYSTIIEIHVGNIIDIAEMCGRQDTEIIRYAMSSEILVADDEEKLTAKRVGEAQVLCIAKREDNFLLYDVVTVRIGGNDSDIEPVKFNLDAATTYDAAASDVYGLDITNGSLAINFLKSERYFFSGSVDAKVTWTAGTASKPAVGSIVNVNISRYHPTGGESTREQLVNAGFTWGASETQRLIGIKNTSTGSYTSLETIFSGDAFSLSFVMPSADCTITTKKVNYVSSTEDTSFTPVFTECANSIYNDFTLNAADAKWENPATSVQGLGVFDVTTYSTIGQSVITPTDSIPVRNGYMFTGWYTENEGGKVVSGDAVEDDNGKTYYAHWAAIKRSLTYSNASLDLAPLMSGRCFVYDTTNFNGTLSWSSETDTPAAGSVVTLRVTQYRPNGGEGTKEQLLNASFDWGASSEKEVIGIQNIDTGSYVSIDTLYSGSAFTLSWVMPSTKECIITTKKIRWRDGENGTSFEPVFEEKKNCIISEFSVNGGKWMNPSTQTLASGTYDTATYSQIGESLSTPSRSIPVRTGYNFIGWYTDATGGNVASGIVTPEDNGKIYYAHWEAATYSLSIKGSVRIYPSESSSGSEARCILYDGSNFIATASWSEGSAAKPSAGAIVNMTVNQYLPNGGEATKDLLVDASRTWGADESLKVVAIRSTTTGSMVSLDSIYSGDVFSFSFVMPASGITLSSKQFQISQSASTFEPVYEDRINSIWNSFVLNGAGSYWQNPATGQLSTYSANMFDAVTYSTVGEAILAPTDSIPVREGYIFTGWFTDPEGGHIVSGNAFESDNGKTYYAHWGNKDSVYYFLRLNGNGASSSIPVNWSIESEKQFSLDAHIFDRGGYSLTSWKDDVDNDYASETLYPAFPDNTTTDMYAQWEPDAYFIEYDLSYEGSVAPERTAYDCDSADFVVQNPAERPGYTFAGWSGTGLVGQVIEPLIQPRKEEKVGLRGDLSKPEYIRYFTANWTAHDYSVKFFNGDEGKTNQEIADEMQGGFIYGTVGKLEPVNLQIAIKPGYHLTSWRIGDAKMGPQVTTNNDGTWAMPADFGDYAPANGATVDLYCIWTPNSFSVKLHDGARGDVQSGFTYGTDKDITKPASFTKAGYAIAGWSLSSSATAADIVFVGENATVTSAGLAAKGKIPANGGTVDLYAVWAMKNYGLYLDMGNPDTTLPATATGWTRGTGVGDSWVESTDAVDANTTYVYKMDSGYTIGQTVSIPAPRGGIKRLSGWTGGAANEVKATASADGAVAYSFAPNSAASDFNSRTYTLLTAQWTSADYTVKWTFNYSDDDNVVVNDTYDDPEARETGAFDGYALTTTETYGSAVALPEIKSECYEFLGWYSSKDAAILASTGASTDGSIYGPYLKGDETSGYTFEPDDDGGRTTIVFFAAWSADPAPYTITLKATEHDGRFGNGSDTRTLDNTYSKTLSDQNIYLDANKPKAGQAGWVFDGWKKEVPATAPDTDPTYVDFDETTTIPRGSGDYTFVAKWKVSDTAYSVVFHKGDEVSDPAKPNDYVRLVPATASYSFSASPDSSVTVPRLSRTSTTGYEFKGWYRATEQNGGLVFTDERLGDDVTSFSGQALVDKAAGLDATTLHYVAKWAPKTFEIQYRYVIDGVDYEMEAAEGDGIVCSAAYGDEVTMPVPAFVKSGEIFSHWSGQASAASLYPNDRMALSELIAAVGSTAEGGKNVVKVYAAWSGVVTSDVPLVVSITFDPEHMDSLVSVSAWISTRSAEPVFVESVTLQRTDDTGRAFAVEGASGDEDLSAYVDLTVKGDAAESGSQPSTLKLNLGNDAVVRGVSDYGLGAFDKTKRVNVSYGLDFTREGCPAPTAFKNLNDRANFKDVRDANGVLKTYPIARLFYTIGLVPPSAATA